MKSVPQNVSESTRRRNPHLYGKNHNPPQGLPATKPESPARKALVNDASRETPRGTSGTPRLAIRYIVRSRRPMDFDNASTKFTTDVLVKAGILPRDGWDILQGQIISEKCNSQQEEGTIIVIDTL